MGDRGTVTRILAIFGTVLVWLPVLAPIVLAFVALFRVGRFLFDYLMPAELFAIVLLGGALLIGSAVRAQSRRALIIWSLVIATVLLFGSQALAVETGLASGAREPSGIWYGLVLGGIIIMDLAVVEMGVGGALLVRDLFRPYQQLDV